MLCFPFEKYGQRIYKEKTMACIIQTQRRALENVLDNSPLKIEKEQYYDLNGEELTLLGVSVGVGTCSDMHGVDIAVFSKEVPFDPDMHHLPLLPKECSGAVLVRKPFSGETDPELPLGHGQKALVAEGLTATCREGRIIGFLSNQRKRFYIPLA